MAVFMRYSLMIFVSTFLISSSWSYSLSSGPRENALDGPKVDLSLVHFQLYTRRNQNNWQTIDLGDLEALESSNFDPTLKTKIYAVGGDNDGSIANYTKDEYLLNDNCNFIIVDWLAIQNGAQNIKNITTETGLHLANYIDYLIDYGASIESFHLMGHSAGAHIVGVAGPSVSSGRIFRITGLDPANGAVWTLNDTDTRLDITDAEFVDIIHTNGGRAIDGNVAFDEPLGHIDFYVNGGEKQPGCPSFEFRCCSHCRATDLFAESINTQVGFIALRCDSYEDYVSGACDGNDTELMGEHVPSNARGIFYVDTNSEAPWACGLCELG